MCRSSADPTETTHVGGRLHPPKLVRDRNFRSVTACVMLRILVAVENARSRASSPGSRAGARWSDTPSSGPGVALDQDPRADRHVRVERTTGIEPASSAWKLR
jgi:hypothetical protein